MKPRNKLVQLIEQPNKGERDIQLAIIDAIKTMTSLGLKPRPNTVYDRLAVRGVTLQRTAFDLHFNDLVKKGLLSLTGKEGDKYYTAKYAAERRIVG